MHYGSGRIVQIDVPKMSVSASRKLGSGMTVLTTGINILQSR